MRTLSTESELRAALQPHRIQAKTIGFVPTMGALHEGHLSLIRLSKLKTDITVVSIFVNPTQFGPNEDFSRYPRSQEEDARMLVEAEVDILFLPEPAEVYPEGNSTVVEVKAISDELEGKIRPGHFRGVSTVVAALFNMVQPTAAFFGQKDAQQVAIVKRMVRDLHFPIEIHVGPTIRSDNHLALSSRNRNLSGGALVEGLALSRTLTFVVDKLKGSTGFAEAITLGKALFRELAPNATLDYLQAVDSETFCEISSFKAVESCTVVIAGRFGDTRLIDNMVIRRQDLPAAEA